MNAATQRRAAAPVRGLAPALPPPEETGGAEAPGLSPLDPQVWKRYATQLINVLKLPDGQRVTVRPVLQQDIPLIEAFYRGLGPQTLQRRMQCGCSNGLSDARVQALTRQGIRHDPAHLVLVAMAVDATLTERVVGHAGWVLDEASVKAEPADRGGALAEFALVVADGLQGRGIGSALMQALSQGAALRGLGWLRGSVLPSNRPMLALMQRQGFWCAPLPDEDGLIEVLGKVEPARWLAPPPRHRDRWLRAWARLHRLPAARGAA